MSVFEHNLPTHITKQLDEIKKLYNISEAEAACLVNMVSIVQLLGYSVTLTSKLLKCLSAMYDVLSDELKRLEKEHDKKGN